MRVAVTLIVTLFAFSIALCQVQKPALGSKERKAILDALRPSIEKDLGQKVLFKVEAIRVYQGWAYVYAHALQSNGKPINFKKTRYREAEADGMFDGDSTYALLKQSGGAWKVRAFSIGPTDVVWVNWMESPYKAPKALFPPPYGK